jgi:hypothetical protein
MLRFVAVAILPCGAMFKVLHTNLWSNLTGAAYTISFWTNAQRYCILPFGAMFTGTARNLWSNFTDTA